MQDSTVSRFRARRGRILRAQIEALADHLRRDIVVLDVGGRPDYWVNVGLARISRILVLNQNAEELRRPFPAEVPGEIFVHKLGDARNLSDYPDQSVDLIHSNSVIEHVGGWADMRAMADEVMRVGRSGWVQTPAWEFPIEPHFRAPFLHWFAHPLQAKLLSLSTQRRQRDMCVHKRRNRVEMIRLLSKQEVKALFPDRSIFVERLILAKSYTVRWMPKGIPAPSLH
jgi:Methyltransferase domain